MLCVSASVSLGEIHLVIDKYFFLCNISITIFLLSSLNFCYENIVIGHSICVHYECILFTPIKLKIA